MSVCANFFVFFATAPSAERIDQIDALVSNRTGQVIRPYKERYGRLIAVEDADLYADVSDDGCLTYLARARSSKLIGEPSIQGQLFQLDPLSRYWSDWYPDGPIVEYVITILSLLAQPDVKWVWYGRDGYQDGIEWQAVTHQTAHAMLDNFITIGQRAD